MNTARPARAFQIGMIGAAIGFILKAWLVIAFPATVDPSVQVAFIVGQFIIPTVGIFAAYEIYSRPKDHKSAGIAMIFFSLLVLWSTLGYSIVGFALCVWGGVLSYRWKPPGTPTTAEP
jgi:hypothetical protein